MENNNKNEGKQKNSKNEKPPVYSYNKNNVFAWEWQMTANLRRWLFSRSRNHFFESTSAKAMKVHATDINFEVWPMFYSQWLDLSSICFWIKTFNVYKTWGREKREIKILDDLTLSKHKNVAVRRIMATSQLSRGVLLVLLVVNVHVVQHSSPNPNCHVSTESTVTMAQFSKRLAALQCTCSFAASVCFSSSLYQWNSTLIETRLVLVLPKYVSIIQRHLLKNLHFDSKHVWNLQIPFYNHMLFRYIAIHNKKF